MNSLYFATSKGGYVCKPLQGKLNVSHSHEIPIYRTVNEFMNYKPSQQNEDMIIQTSKQTEMTDIQKNLTLPTIRPQNKKLSALASHTHTNSSACEETPNEEDLAYSQCKQRDLSCRETSASQIGQINGGSKLKLSMIQRNVQVQELFDRRMLQQEIEKEKTLRKNLENSYNNLLQKLQWEKEAKFQEFQPSSPLEQTKAKKNKNKRHSAQVQAPSTNSPQESSKDRFKDHEPSQQIIYPFASVSNHYIQHLNDQRLFQTNLVQQLQQTKERLAQIEGILQEQQRKKEIDSLHQILQKKNIEILELKVQMSSKRQSFEYSFEGFRKQIPLIALFFMMFLIIAMVAKGQKC